jgi:hypothetical protein
MSDRKRQLLRPRALVLLAAVAAFFVFVGVGSGGVNDNGFIELDGNAFAAGPHTSPTSLDWSCLFGRDGVPGIPDPNCYDGGSPPPKVPIPGLSTFVTDFSGSLGDKNDDGLTQGSKDIEDISQWVGSASIGFGDKDDIEHAAWASFTDPSQGPAPGDLITYFTADLAGNNGDAFLGFWFFKGQVTRNSAGVYSGSHVDGDVLVLVDNSGPSQSPSEMGVFQWDTGCTGSVSDTSHSGLPCTSAANFAQVQPVGSADCATSSSADVCAIFNLTGADSNPANNLPSAWHFQSTRAHSAANIYDATEFVEGGINLTKILKGNDCFTTVQAETRSSSALTAEIKDTVVARLNTCGTIKIVKDATPDSASTAFGFTASGLTPTTFNLTDDGSNGGKSQPQTYLDVKPTTAGGGPYSVAENTPPAGWTQTGATCDNGSPVSAITVARGETVTCTFTNVQTPKLHLRKIVTNNNGGTATVADFTLTANGTGSNDISGTSPVDSGSSLTPDTWALSETGPSGYTASSWVCVGGSQSGSNITLTAGQEATCTITNNDIPPKLHLRKIVTNDNGGTATVANFTLTANGTGSNDLSGTSPVDSDAGLLADTWALSETNVTGYTASAWSCVGGTQSGSNITVGIGGEATCTITNNDIPPKLHLRKIVTNDNGGTATVANFTLTANGTGSNDLSGTSPVDSGTGLLADTWALSESGPSGYTASSWVCVGGSQSGSNITLTAGNEETSTITNNVITPKLHLRKIVTNDNGGTATVADFTLTANGTGSNDLSGTSPVDSTSSLQADTWALSETNVTGYTASAWTCVGGSQSGSNITVGIGGEATCTITNDDIPGHARVVKTFQGQPLSGTQAFTFQLRTGADLTHTGTVLETLVANAANSGTISFTTDLSAGTTYNLCEAVIPGFKQSFTGFGPYNPNSDANYVCVDFTVQLGQTLTINVDNTPPPGGNAATIGYWKNWSSCKTSNGNQAPVLDQTLFKAGTITIGTLVLHGGATANVSPDCSKAVNILNKTTIDGKKKMASDPLFNMAAQLLAADLNIVAGAGTCPAAIDAITAGQALLVKYGWNGLTYSPKLTAADAALANSLNTTLDKYNNNNLC